MAVARGPAPAQTKQIYVVLSAPPPSRPGRPPPRRLAIKMNDFIRTRSISGQPFTPLGGLRAPPPPTAPPRYINSFSLHHDPYGTGVVFGRRCRRMSLTQIAS
ncbi:hypothetical protein EVAR_66343_1 [Eumeta japonica]|uniref:Uncharacterized protein n=1 Tax=Eumeta variegata TaxID=151549 RepID=A0A4C2A678_EUMVA|nr:hypothetical protein EVAR_66343_1 [Eumeta japonica]